MNKVELISKVAEVTGSTKINAESAVNTVLDTIVNAVAANEKVQIVGFGSFEKRHHESREGRNPKDGSVIQIEAKDVPAFKAGKAFKDSVK